MALRILGLDPGLRITGWGVIAVEGSRLTGLGEGVLTPPPDLPLPQRLARLHDDLVTLLARWQPAEAAVEETFVNRNPGSALKLGQARGVVLMTPAAAGVPVTEYAATTVKKSLVGKGHAAKEQVQAMVKALLPGVSVQGADAADALAVAICHAHHRASLDRWQQAGPKGI